MFHLLIAKLRNCIILLMLTTTKKTENIFDVLAFSRTSENVEQFSKSKIKNSGANLWGGAW